MSVLTALGLVTAIGLGSGCNSSRPAPSSPPPSSAERPAPPAARAERIEEIPAVPTEALTASERRSWVDLANDMLSPCGEPVSVAKCGLQQAAQGGGGACRSCVPAARYLVRLVREGYERGDIETFYASRYSPDTRVDFPDDGAPVRGGPMSPITIVEFSDFQCPYCAAAAPVLERVLAELEGRVKLVFRQYPLSGHVRAMPAARAAIAAGKQDKFWEMHDLLFENQRALEDADLDRYARQLGLDLTRFHADMQAAETQARIDSDRAIGRRAGVDSTPGLYINGRKFREPIESLVAYLREELEQ